MHRLYRKQILDTTIEEAWEFFIKPENLKVITPDFMGFDIQSVSGPRALHAGQIITYIVRPFLSIPFRWVTEITHERAPEFFVDEQRLGPFLFWHHKHYLKVNDQGKVEMIDEVHYKVFYGFVGAILNALIVKRRLDVIFDYRTKVIARIFNKKEPEVI